MIDARLLCSQGVESMRQKDSVTKVEQKPGAAMSRIVQCPKCRVLLQEPPPGNPYYQCGSCSTTLQGQWLPPSLHHSLTPSPHSSLASPPTPVVVVVVCESNLGKTCQEESEQQSLQQNQPTGNHVLCPVVVLLRLRLRLRSLA